MLPPQIEICTFRSLFPDMHEGQKGQKAKSRIRDIQKMKQGIKQYEEALESGVTADEYKKNTGVSKSKIFHWRKAVAKKEQSED